MFRRPPRATRTATHCPYTTLFRSTDIGLIATTAGANVATMTAAESAMSLVDGAIDVISEARASPGGLVSSFEFRGQQPATSLENIDAAKSSIMYVDLAAEQSTQVSNTGPVQAAGSSPPHPPHTPQA